VSVTESSIIIKLTGIDSPFVKGARGIWDGLRDLLKGQRKNNKKVSIIFRTRL
jgi:hypothetical protein